MTTTEDAVAAVLTANPISSDHLNGLVREAILAYPPRPDGLLSLIGGWQLYQISLVAAQRRAYVRPRQVCGNRLRVSMA
jgi:hypothetical protein